ncbi:MAG: sigma 54-interacting transcriptional regulator [Magnetococcales bacterium]|nr:sigma 54-interacting transcriptional regulator [Magnetococcales bacterium]
MSADKRTNTLLKSCIVLVEMELDLEQRVRQVLDAVAPIRTVTSKEMITELLKEETIGLVLVAASEAKRVKENTLSYFDNCHSLSILAIDTNAATLTILQPGLAPVAEEVTRYGWNTLRDLATRLLQLADFRLESFLLREAFEAVTVGIQEAVLIVDRSLRVRSVNPVARTHCHFSTVATLESALEATKGGCIPQLSDLLQRVITSRKAELNVSLQCTQHSETEIEIRVSVTPLIDPLGHCHGAAVVVLDRTQRPGAEESGIKRQNFYRIIGASPVMQEVYTLVESLAGMDTTTLITGESGTGKEMVAEAIHMKGSRSHGPLVKVNCSALSEHLLESELFGHVKGAFTGAVRDRPGRFEVATGGTLFLDEIGDVSLSMQSRLLRVLQERELERVGDSRTIKVDVRVVAATNKNLAELITLGKFREDLYFRLNVVEVALPPLRKRLEDIPLLVSHFIQKFNHKYSKAIVGVQEAAMDLFLQYRWPGNIRELENAIEHAFVVCRQGTIRIKHLPNTLLVGRPCADPPLLEAVLEEKKEVESAPRRSASADADKEIILRALEAAHWNKKKAALLSGISRSTFYRKMEKHGIR